MGYPAHAIYMGHIGERIRRSYLAAGMNRHSFSKAVGASYSSVQRWESHEVEPRHEYLLRIAEVCSIPVEQLLNDDQPLVAAKGDEVAPEFREWLDSSAPDDLTEDERDTLASWKFHGTHPGPAFYSSALGTWRMSVARSASKVRRVRM